MDLQTVKINKWLHFEDVHDCPAWFLWSPIMSYGKYLREEFNVGLSKALYIFSDGDLYMYFDEKDYISGGEEILKKIQNNPDFILSILDKIEYHAKELFEFAEKLKRQDFSSLKKEELFEIYKNFFFIHDKLWHYGQVVNLMEHAHSLFVPYVKQELLNSGVEEKKIVEVLNSFSKVEEYSCAQKEEQNLIQLAKNGYTEKELKKHCEKYAFMGYGWAGPAWGEDFFRGRLEALVRDKDNYNLISEAEYSKEIKEEKNKLAKKYSLDERTLKLLKAVERIGFLKALRIDASYLAYWVLEPMFREIGKRFNLSLKQVQFILPPEMQEFLNGEKIPDEHLLNQRRKKSVLAFEWEKWQEFAGAEVEDPLQKLRKGLDNYTDIRELTGDSAYPGKVKGVVRVINKPDEFEKMQENDILVSHVTDPRYVPIMKKASAVVADVGGITCHAAIVSRELNIPCVIGTKVATKVFKDGDEVEVDASRGVVKKLS